MQWIVASLLLVAACREDPSEVPASDPTATGSTTGSDVDAEDATTVVSSECVPGESRPCYEGPPGTEGVGICAAGVQVCAEDGVGWSACGGQTWPEAEERCDTPQDDDCDGWFVCEPALAWTQELPGYVRGIGATPTGDIVVVGTDGWGGFQGEDLAGMFVMRLDSEGTLRWVRSVAGPMPNAVAVGEDGTITVVGVYEGTPDLGGGRLPASVGNDAFAVRYGPEGEFQWDHAATTSGYHAVAVGADGTTYVVGGYIFEDDGPEAIEGRFFVEAIDASGARSWIQVGQGDFGIPPESMSVAVGTQGQVLLGIALTGDGLSFGPMAIEVDGIQVALIRMDHEGNPQALVRVPDVGTSWVGRVRTMARPQGPIVVASVHAQDTGHANVMLAAFDDALELQSEHWVGQDAYLGNAGALPDGSTVFDVEFASNLELGPLGVTGFEYQWLPALAAVDDDGNARWVEVLYSQSYIEIFRMAPTPDGAIVLSGLAYEEGASLGGGTLQGSFLARLRP